MLDHEFDEKLMKNNQPISNPSSILSFDFNGVLENFVENLGFDLEKWVHLGF